MKNEDYYMSQEFYNEIMGEVDKGEDLRMQEQERKNNRLFKAIINVKGFSFLADLLHDFRENECSGDVSITNKPRGEKQSDYWGKIKGVYVDQYTGYECDDYYGWIYFPLKEKKFLKCHYAC